MFKLSKVTTNLRNFNIVKNALQVTTKRCNGDVYVPDYLTLMTPDIPEYTNINIELKGYDYPILENYQSYVHRYAKVLDLDVEESFALPPQKFQVRKFRVASSVVDCEYSVNIYERNIQVFDVPSVKLPTLLRIIQETLPQGLSLDVTDLVQEKQSLRFVPDNKLAALQQELVDGTYKEEHRKKLRGKAKAKSATDNLTFFRTEEK